MNDLVLIQQRIQALLPRADALSDAYHEASAPRLEVDALQALSKMADRSEALRRKGVESGAETRAFERAVAELGQNVTELEQLVSSTQCPPFAYVTWAWRVCQSLLDYSRGAEPRVPEGETASATTQSEAASGATTTSAAPLPALRAPAALLPPLSLGAGLRVNAVAPLLDLAARETSFVQRRRRLLEAARRALLEAQANVDLPHQEVQPRLLHITEQIRTLNTLQSAGLSPTVDVSQQLRSAILRRDAALTLRCLLALQHFSRCGGAREPVRRLAELPPERLPGAVSLSAERADERSRPPAQIWEAVERGLSRSQAQRRPRSSGVVQQQLADLGLGARALSGLKRGVESVDGCFELGRSVAPVRSQEEQARLRPVPYPTQTMVLRPAESVGEIATSLVGDPRLLLLDFATGRLLARSYLGSPRVGPPSGERVSEARYYLLDGSDSMLGRRGLLRDSLLLSELSSLIEFLSQPGAAPIRPVVYYRYFAQRAEPARRVATREEALRAIEDCLARQRSGGTDIEAALLSSLEEIRRERDKDETLKRAHLVLVSDGVARIDLGRVWSARLLLGEIPVGISVIALGSENETLKRLCAAQRRAGHEVFYHFLPDPSIRKLVDASSAPSGTATGVPPRGTRAGAPPSRPDEAADVEAVPERPEANDVATASTPPGDDDAKWRELGALVDELFALQAELDVEAIEEGKSLLASLAELGLSLERDYSDSQRARLECLNRDERILKRRFDRWFPDLAGAEPSPPEREGVPATSDEPMATLEALLGAVIEIIEVLDGPPLQRRYDAIEVFERLLLEAGIPPWRYADELTRASPRARAAILEIRRVVAVRE